MVTLSCTCLAEDFDDVLDVLADVARNAAFPPDEIEKRRAEIITAIRQDQDNTGVRAAEALQRLLYGDAPSLRTAGEGHASRPSSASRATISSRTTRGASRPRR